MVSQRTLGRRDLLRAEIQKRESSYGEFIKECSSGVVDSIERKLEKPETLLPIYERLNRIRLCASDAVLREAERALILQLPARAAGREGSAAVVPVYRRRWVVMSWQE